MKILTKKDLLIPKRKKNSHKGQSGRVLVIGGSTDYVGAVALAGVAALRAGCDLVVVATPEKVAWAINALYPDLITKKLRGDILTMSHYKELRSMMLNADVTLIGNGIGQNKKTQKLVRKLVSLPGYKVIDADAIKAITIQELIGTIITPHQKEYDTLMANSGLHDSNDPAKMQEQLQNYLSKNNVLVLKGEVDIIISQDELIGNKTGNPGLAKGGTGDVLAGLCAGFYAQLKEPLQSAKNATYICGKIGDILLKKHRGYSYIASDMIDEIKKV